MALLLLVAAAAVGGGPDPGEPAPDFALKSTAGSNLRLSEYRGEVVLLTFWSSRCGRCMDQLPQIEVLHQRYDAAAVRLLSVSFDRKARDARDTAAELGLSFPVMLDDGRDVTRRYDPGRLPLTLILDPAGTVRYRHEGYRGDDVEIYAEQLDSLLAEEAGIFAKAGMQ